jgi:two-component system, cell cycle response regulator
MSNEIAHGNVLLATDDREAGERLARWIGAAGERAVLLSGGEKFLLERGDDETVDLVVTDLDTDDPPARALLDRLLSGAVFAGVPQVHLFRDLSLRDDVLSRHPALAAVSLPSPPEASEFQARVRLAAEVGRLRRELQRSAIRDPMTGLFNRRYVLHRLDEEFSRARRYRTPLSLVLFDIDQLKAINDALGQTTGDSVIRRLAQVLRSQVRKEDVLGRVGEESFGIVLIGTRYRGAAVCANKVRSDTEEILLPYHGDHIQVRVSAGISTYPDNAVIDSGDDLIRTTENALAEAKARGGNRVFIDEGVLRKERRVVLVADPDPGLLDLAEDLLGLDDYRVVRADSARAVLETLRFRRPDLLILDLQMAEQDGNGVLLEKIQEMFPGARFPVIGLSREPGADPERLVRLGVDRYITKPFSLSLLRGIARELLEAYRPG